MESGPCSIPSELEHLFAQRESVESSRPSISLQMIVTDRANQRTKPQTSDGRSPNEKAGPKDPAYEIRSALLERCSRSSDYSAFKLIRRASTRSEKFGRVE